MNKEPICIKSNLLTLYLYFRCPEYTVKKDHSKILSVKTFQLFMTNIGQQCGVLKLDFKVF